MNPHGRLQDGTTALLLILLTVALSMGTANGELRTATPGPQHLAHTCRRQVLVIVAQGT